tara:strand:- start:263 stop:1114 length:852 start_codon:yes stop_codon:yes gene_type:complete
MDSLYFKSNSTELHLGSALEVLKTFDNEIVDCVVTSPPYYNLRDYQNDQQLGMEKSPVQYVANLVEIFNEIKRILKDDGVVWLNLGDTYAKDKNLLGIPWRVAFALQESGWYLRSDIIWQKTSILPESVKDRCTKSHEYIFMLTKSQNYYYNAEAIKEPTVSKDNYTRDRDNPNNKTNTTAGRSRMGGMKHNNYETRNKRSVWTMAPHVSKDYHFATYPKELPMNCIKASCRENGLVLDPFVGSGTTVQVAEILGRKSVGIDIQHKYLDLCLKKIQQRTIWFH